jgi:transcriptional regulator with XRE-family HTH domain
LISVGDASAGEGWFAAARALKDRMAELGLTQFDLASKSGVSIATIREMLHARPRQRSPRTLSAISKALGWPAGQLASTLEGERGSARGVPEAEPDTGAELKAIRDELGRISRRLEILESRQAATE